MRPVSSWALRVGVLVGGLWLISIVLLSSPATEDTELSQRFKKAAKELDTLKNQNEEIKSVLNELTTKIRELTGPANGADANEFVDLQIKLDKAQKIFEHPDVNSETLINKDFIPSKNYEVKRRLLDRSLQETFFYFEAQLNSIKEQVKGTKTENDLNKIIADGLNRIRVSNYDFETLSNTDGLRRWREKEASDLSDTIQQQIHKLQNPTDCSSAKKLVCNLNKGCGYGCQIHHISYCLIVAYATDRTLILKSKGWRYNKDGIEDVFQPLSETCLEPSGVTHAPWPASENIQVIDLPIIDTLSQRPNYLPQAIPDDLSERIIRISGNPAAWWVGQFLKYILKLQPDLINMLETAKSQMDFQNPVVGLHIRRTDKVGTEAAFHTLDEYMHHAEEFFTRLSLRDSNVVRRVFVASDEPSVIDEAKKKYTNYTVYGNADIAKSAAVATRYTDSSLKGIITDIHFLSLCDYLVCTFSSQVCRIAYEIMHSLHPEAAYSFRSLDDIYYFGGQNVHYQRARFPHKAASPEEMNLKVGDLVNIAGNHWDGYSKGTNRRMRHTALYPSYKMEEVIDVQPFRNIGTNPKRRDTLK